MQAWENPLGEALTPADSEPLHEQEVGAMAESSTVRLSFKGMPRYAHGAL